MGEKGNVTAEELAQAASATAQASGLGAVVAGAGTTVTAVFQDTAESFKDKVIDKGLDAGIESAQERYLRSHPAPEASGPAAAADDAPGTS